MKKIIIHAAICILLVTFYSCHQQPVTNPKDYAAYLTIPTNQQLQRIDTEMDFWKKRLAGNPGDMISESKIASLLTRRFAYSGAITEIHMADSLLQQVNNINRTSSSGTFRSLAANCITQHRFLQAQQYIDTALALGDNKFTTVLMEFDVAMELGNRYRARKALNSLTDKTSFEYLIRAAKYKDHAEGNLSEAIVLMEKALSTIKDNPSPALYLWTESNLGDLYGHANRYKQSYQCYLNVLQKDPNYYHALKGIAWLTFSHDKDVANARKIVAYLQQQHPVPDYELLLLQMSDWEHNTTAKQQHTDTFMDLTHDPLYGGMYNKYLFTLQANELNNAAASLQIAQQEVHNRPTPEAFSWLAWAQCKNGHVQEALRTARLYVANKCFEPDAMYYLGMIYKTAGDKATARAYLQTARNSSFELGPMMSSHINDALKTL